MSDLPSSPIDHAVGTPNHVVLLPVFDVAQVEPLLTLGRAIAGPQGRVVVAGIVAVPEEQPLSAGTVAARRLRAELDALIDRMIPGQAAMQPSVTVGRGLAATIRTAAEEQAATFLLMGWWGGAASAERLFGSPIEELLYDPPCDLAVARLNQLPPWHGVLLPVRGGPHTPLAYETALALATLSDTSITVLYVTDSRLPEDSSAHAVVETLRHKPRVTQYLEERSMPIEQALLAAMTDHDLVVMGITGRQDDPEAPVGPVASHLLRYTATNLMLISHRMTPQERETQQRWQRRYDLSAVVDRWFAQNTFSSTEFDGLQRLLGLKREQGLTISLALPTLNEEATIGEIIHQTQQALMVEVPLLDEIVLIDSGSDDRTREIAVSAGIPVYLHPEILPQYGSFTGKGEALWKSLYVLKGDLIAWVDTDIRNFHPRFVYGILGPLLRAPRLVYSKGFYRRPIQLGDALTNEGGGRVTELVARPLLNLFYPELSGMLQPLAGEYAGRRTALEQVPFFTGYGVESGLLLDLLQKYGLAALAQVDLLQRIHRNQELQPLSKMAFAILQVILRRVEQRYPISLVEIANQSMKLIRYVDEEGFQLEVRRIRDHERPPMAAIPEYRQRYGALKAEWE